MNRRNFLAAGGSAVAGGVAAPAAGTRKAIFELRWYHLRNGSQIPRTSEYLSKTYLPAAKRSGAGPFGFFGAVIGAGSPFVLAVTSFPSLAAFEAASEKMAADKDFARGSDEYNRAGDPGYIRMENSILRAFDSIPSMEPPPLDSNRPPRIFELRIYESPDLKTGRRKIKMFDDAEIAIFRRCGLLPVFFGETIVGPNLPNLTYMLAYDDMAAREKGWKAFGADPEWHKLRSTPGLTDPEIVTNISNSILRPLSFSEIR
jgi:NIPSNAP protein